MFVQSKILCLSLAGLFVLGACSQSKSTASKRKKSNTMTSTVPEECTALHVGLPPEKGSTPTAGAGLVDDPDELMLTEQGSTGLPTDFASLVPTLGAVPTDFNTRLFVNVNQNPDLDENFYLSWVLCTKSNNPNDCLTGKTNSTQFYIPVTKPDTYTQLAVSYCVRHTRRHLSGYLTDNDPNCTAASEGVIDVTFTRPDYQALARSYDAQFPPKTTDPNLDLSMVRAVEDMEQIESDIDEYQQSIYDMGVYIWNYYEAHGKDGTFPPSQAGFIEDIHNMGPDLFALNASTRMLDDIDTLVQEVPNIKKAQETDGLSLTDGTKPGDCTQNPLLSLAAGTDISNISNDGGSTASASSRMQTAFDNGETPLTNGTTADTSPIIEEKSDGKEVKQGLFGAGVVIAAAGGIYALANLVALGKDIYSDYKKSKKSEPKSGQDPAELEKARKSKIAENIQKQVDQKKKDFEEADRDLEAKKKAQSSSEDIEAAQTKRDKAKKKLDGATQAKADHEAGRTPKRGTVTSSAAGDSAKSSGPQEPKPKTQKASPAQGQTRQSINQATKSGARSKMSTPSEVANRTKNPKKNKTPATKEGKIGKVGRVGRAVAGIAVAIGGGMFANMFAGSAAGLTDSSVQDAQLINGRPAELFQATGMMYLMLQDLPNKTKGLHDLFNTPDTKGFFEWASAQSDTETR